MWIRGVRWSAVSVIGVVVLLSSQQQHRLSDTFTGWNDAVLRVENRTHSHKNNTNRTNESTAIGIIPTTTVAEDDLFDWERESIDAIKSVRSTKRDADRGCNPPKGVSIKCCIGWSNQESFACRGKRWQDYQRVQKIARRHTVPLVHSKEEQEAHDGQCRDDACHIVRLLIQHNLTLSFIGDSIAHQMVEGFICALQRRGWEANVSKLPHDNVSLNIEVENRVNVTFFHHLAFPDPANLFDEVLATTDVLVVNYGLHWAIDARRPRWQPDVYRSQWNNTLSRWGQVSKLPKLLVYRESSAQHFDADGGEYFIRNEETREHSAVATAATRRTNVATLWMERTDRDGAGPREWLSGRDGRR